MNIEKMALIAQAISFEFEDQIANKDKKELFVSLFDKYLNKVDPGITTDPYDAMVALAKKHPDLFENMVKEMTERKLISLD